MTNNKKISDYIQRLVYQEPIIICYRNSSMDEFMEEIVLLGSELNAMGKNFNRVFRRLNSSKEDHRCLPRLHLLVRFRRSF